MGEVKFAAEIKVGLAGRRGAFAACVLESDIPASLRKGALWALGGELAIRNHGVGRNYP